MKAAKYRLMEDSDLERELGKLRLELVKAYGNMELAKVKNKEGDKSKGTNLQPRIRKEIAKILTIQKEREK